MVDHPIAFWLIAIVAGMLVGFSKTGMPGLGILIVPMLAMIWPAKMSVGALLPMLIIGDVFAITWYKRHAQWDRLKLLFPWVVPGMAGAWLVLRIITNDDLKPLLGAIVLVLLAVDLARRRLRWDKIPGTWWFAGITGFLGGFTTTIGNAAGPVMGLYFVSMRFRKQEFMGTAAWFFGIVNLTKVPIFVTEGMITWPTLRFDLCVLPAIVLGALIGIKVLPKIPQRGFDLIVKVLAAVVAVRLLIP